MRKTLCIFILIFSFLIPTIGLGKEGIPNPIPYKKTDHRYYSTKGDMGQFLTLEEFNILMEQIEDAIKAFKKAFSKIRIEDANFSYTTGKKWETKLDRDKGKLLMTLMLMTSNVVKKRPNLIEYSLKLYVKLLDVVELAESYAHIPVFKKTLNDTDLDLYLWNKTFLKAHLTPLAGAKDTGEELYRDIK
ncbi:hypothetical protein ES702_07310 [subsurface metagenome]